MTVGSGAPGSSAPARRTVRGPGPLYGIVDVDAVTPEDEAPDPETVAAAAAAMARGGAGWIQLRAKRQGDDDLLRHARACGRALAGTGARFWVDDRPDVAALAGAHGVHLGQEDLPPAVARRVVGPGCWIGRSTHDREQALEAVRDPEVDVIAVGPVFATRSKERPDPVVGLELVRWTRARTGKTLVAIGGIDRTTLPAVLGAGADSAAVLGALCRPAAEGGPAAAEAAARRLVGALHEIGDRPNGREERPS